MSPRKDFHAKHASLQSSLGSFPPWFSKAGTYQIHSSCLDNHPSMCKCRNQFHLYSGHHSDKDLNCTGSHLQKQAKTQITLSVQASSVATEGLLVFLSHLSSFLSKYRSCELPHSRWNKHYKHNHSKPVMIHLHIQNFAISFCSHCIMTCTEAFFYRKIK